VEIEQMMDANQAKMDAHREADQECVQQMLTKIEID
jgi:hypothetical protein